ncbi:MAG: hypothetical protein HYY37_01140 [Candidatus Aenigmarchaeota archaeon]|nr:hypothetical protein [Candidatus Aenigmarchaeota archaeon]
MGRLQEIITREFGERIIRMPDPLGELTPPDDALYDALGCHVADPSVHEAFDGIFDAVRAMEAAARADSPDEYDRLAVGLHGHDLRNMHAVLASSFRLSRSRPGLLRDREFLDTFSAYEQLFRLFGATMAYLSSAGDARYTLPVPFSRVGWLLQVPARGIKLTALEHPPVGHLQSPEYVVLHQFASNAPVGFGAVIDDGGAYTTLSVSDRGPGIRDACGSPLPPERFSELFGGFTTKERGRGHGGGLQIADGLSRLRGGYIDVRTGTEAHEIQYTTRDGRYSVSPPNGFHGTRFTLHVPHSNSFHGRGGDAMAGFGAAHYA